MAIRYSCIDIAPGGKIILATINITTHNSFSTIHDQKEPTLRIQCHVLFTDQLQNAHSAARQLSESLAVAVAVIK